VKFNFKLFVIKHYPSEVTFSIISKQDLPMGANNKM